MFQGLRTVVYHVADLKRATEWYSSLLGIAPYFDTPYYVGYNVGGYELGLHPIETPVISGTSVATYWGVEDVDTALARMVEMGAVVHFPVTDVGDDIKLADVIDPFGNIVGIIRNPHFKLG